RRTGSIDGQYHFRGPNGGQRRQRAWDRALAMPHDHCTKQRRRRARAVEQGFYRGGGMTMGEDLPTFQPGSTPEEAKLFIATRQAQRLANPGDPLNVGHAHPLFKTAQAAETEAYRIVYPEPADSEADEGGREPAPQFEAQLEEIMDAPAPATPEA